jgi:hypothetical protein
MKTIIILVSVVLILSCSEDSSENEDPFYTNFHDIALNSDAITYQARTYSFDLDKDYNDDITIEMKEGFSIYNPYESYIQIATHDNWEILYEKVEYIDIAIYPGFPDTVYYYYQASMPRIASDGDTIHFMDNFTSEVMKLVYREVPGPQDNRQGVTFNQWVGIGYNYIAFRKISVEEKKMAWLKVNVIRSDYMQVSECVFVKDEELIINDN